MPGLRSSPGIGHRIARTEPEGLDNVSLGFFGATDEDSYQVQSRHGRLARFRSNSNTYAHTRRCLSAARLVIMSTNPKLRMAERMVRDRGQGFGQLRFGRREGRHGTGDKEICALGRVRARRSNERVDIAGIGGERAIEKAFAPAQTLSRVIPLLNHAKP